MSRAMLVGAARRLLVMFFSTAGATVLVSLLAGIAAGSSVSRSVSLGFYVTGSFLTIAGFFIGNRGPVRLKGHGGAPLFGSRFARWATPREREETINESAIFVFLGLVLILLGIVVDSRVRLV